MKKFLFYLMALPSVFFFVACGDNGDDNPVDSSGGNSANNAVTVTLTSANFTKDGYFDGILYYRITSNSPQEVTVNKAEESAVVVEIPSIVSIDDSNYKCTSIAENAFYRCSNMTMVTIPPTIKSIGKSAFSGCNNLAGVNIYDLAAWCNIEFDNNDSNPLYYNQGYLFLNGKEINELNIPKGVTAINDYAFWGCNSLTSINIPNSVTSIGNWVFWDCRRLTSIDIPSSVTSIGSTVFIGCQSLTSIHCRTTVPLVIPDYYGGEYIGFFDNATFSTATLYVPKGTLEAYKSSDGWRHFKNIVEE